MKKRFLAKAFCVASACAMMMNFAAFSTSAEYVDGLFDYDRYNNDEKYKIETTVERRWRSFNDWYKESDEDKRKKATFITYRVRDVSTDNSYDPVILRQKIDIRFKLSDNFVNYFPAGRTFRGYSYEKWNNDDPPRESEKINDEHLHSGFSYSFYYRDSTYGTGTDATLMGDTYISPNYIEVFQEGYNDHVPFEETVENIKQELDEAKRKRLEEYDTSGRYNITADVKRIDYEDRVVFTYFSRVETPEYGSRTLQGSYKDESKAYEVIQHWHYWEDWTIYEIKRIKELPGCYLKSQISAGITENYEIGEKHPVKEAVELHELNNERYDYIKNVLIPDMSDLQYEVNVGEIDRFGDEETHIVVDTDAAPLPDDAKKDDTPGRKTNETSTDIPAVIFVSTAGVAAAAGAAGASGKNKKDNKKKSTFRLAINKQFGDTIRMQGKPEFVYARIIEVTPEGHEFTREDLSEKIRIYAGSAGINVEETGMIGGYKSARVFAPKSDEVECIVSFRFEYEGNSYTNNVRFWLEEPGILFYQENLALPAKYDKEAELPFTVTGFEPDKATVALRMSEGAPYHVQLVESENDPSTHWAVLTDICDKDQDAGTMLDCYLIVSVTDGEVTIEEQFPVTRVGLGLNFAMPALNCFRIPKKSAEGKRWDELTYSDFEAATTTARVVLILFDEEQQRIIQMPADPTFELTPIVNDDISKERIDGLGLKTRLTKVESGYSEVTFFCEKGWLEPPVRLFMNIKATWKYGEGDKKETYVCEKKVLMRSQPLREYKNENMRTAAYKTDKERFELLDRMTDMILHNNWFDELEELYARAFLMMKYYDPIYGYDDLQFEQIHGAFMSYLGYRQAKLEYAAAKDNYQADKKNDDLLHEIAFRAGAMNSSWTGIISRIALGICTGGGSEIFLTPLDIINSGVEYQMENLPEEQTTWGKLWAGVKAPVISLGIGYAFKLGGWAGGKLVNAGKAAYRATAKAVPKIAKYTADKVSKSALLPKSLKNGIQKASKYFDELAESVPECDPKGLKGSASAAQEAMEQAVLRGEASADDIIKSLSGDLTQLEKLQVAAVEAGNKEGAELLNGLKAAIDNYRLSGKSPMTEGALRENIVKMCRNKFAIEQMIAENPGQADIYRKLFTKYRAQFFYEPVKNESRKHIAEMLGCSIDDIQIKSVSGNTSTALENGVTIGHDLDVTFIYKSKDGKTLIELPQAIAEDALYKTGCKKAGLNFSSMKEAKELAESLQLHACQPSDGERLPEVQKIIDKYFRTSQLSAESVPKFKNAEIYKTVPMYNEAMEALRKVAPSEPEAAALAKKLADYTSGKGTLDAACKTAINSVGNMRDTFRAAVKGGNLVKGKAVGALTVSGESGLNSRYHTIMSICDKARKGKITIPEANKSLAKMGFNVETALNEAFGMIGEVNKRLGAGSSGAVAEGVSNAARSAASASAGSYTQD